MFNYDLVDKLLDIVNNYKTVYMWGVFGAPLTENLIVQKSNQYPQWYTKEKQAFFRSLIGKGYFGFDCVNVIKGIVWGWNGDTSKSHGGAKYVTNNCPDTSANGMINICKNVRKSFTDIEVGEAVWTDGHIGVYIGDGLVVECTPIWKNNVQITGCSNIKKSKIHPNRMWKSHGYFPFIEYNKDEQWKTILKNKTTNPNEWIKFVDGHTNDDGIGKYLKELIVKLGG